MNPSLTYKTLGPVSRLLCIVGLAAAGIVGISKGTVDFFQGDQHRQGMAEGLAGLATIGGAAMIPIRRRLEP